MADVESQMMRAALRTVAPLLPQRWRDVARLLAASPPATPAGSIAVEPDAAAANLEKVDNVVVLMLENRSFDHMLGYLTLGGRTDIDGLKGSESNKAPDGSVHTVHPLGGRTAFTSEAEDPDHSGTSVDEQIAGDCAGFVTSYARYSAATAARLKVPVPDPGLVMGYYTDQQLPAYDFLARQYCVCDRWFSSVPGATWPNRLYALSGRSAGVREDLSPPLYALPTFPRLLDQAGVDWCWYSYDPATLRLADPQYRFSNHHRFAFVDSRKVSIEEDAVGLLFETGESFLEAAAAERLPAVSWIDPHWKDLRVLAPDSNDDHPPSDVTAGQQLVLAVYNALRNSPQWERTLLIITYDEHGGFYDHVSPPAAAGEPPFDRYGVRVPALVVSPLVEAGSVARSAGPASEKLVLDHTSIIKTVLLRFCSRGGLIPDLGPRVTAANHLGALLTRSAPRGDNEIEDHAPVVTPIQQWSERLHALAFAPTLEPPMPPRALTDFQDGFYKATRLLRSAGLPAGHP
jgi:phospholipase C